MTSRWITLTCKATAYNKKINKEKGAARDHSNGVSRSHRLFITQYLNLSKPLQQRGKIAKDKGTRKTKIRAKIQRWWWDRAREREREREREEGALDWVASDESFYEALATARNWKVNPCILMSARASFPSDWVSSHRRRFYFHMKHQLQKFWILLRSTWFS